MAISWRECGALILAGGRARRMGRCKATLPIGEGTLLQHLVQELAPCAEINLSANDPRQYPRFPGRVIPDRYPGCGPLAGIHAGLRATALPYLFCVPCDMPCFTGRLIPPMLAAFDRDLDALVCVDGGGRVQPLCGIYAKSALPVMEQALEAGDLRVMALLDRIRTGYVSAPPDMGGRVFLNLNTPEAYRAYLESVRGEG